MLAANPSLSPNQVKQILQAQPAPVAGGADTAVGAGAVDAAAAVQLAPQPGADQRANGGRRRAAA